MLNIAICADKTIGRDLLKFIIKKDKRPIKLVLTKDGSLYQEEIEKLCIDNDVKCYKGFSCNSDEFKSLLQDHDIDMGLLLWWPDILKKHIIDTVRIGFVNTHPSYLPYNKGKHPYYWAVINDTPPGNTLHFINEKVDDGEILFQEPYNVDITDTGDIIYDKSLSHMKDLFKKSYDDIISLNFEKTKQDPSKGDFHYARDIEKHSKIDLDKSYKAKDLINILRARTFKNNKSAFFMHNGEKYYVRVEIEKDEGQYE